MPRTETPTTPAPATLTAPSPLDDETRASMATVQEHAATCGRLDCGHLYRSTSPAVREAVILYTAEGMGLTVNLDRVSAATAAIVGVLRQSNHARPVYTRGRTANGGTGNRQHANGVTLVMPNPWGITMTPQRLQVFTALLRGKSITTVAAEQSRTVETVKSHSGNLKRDTGAHDAPSALLALVSARRLSHRAISVPDAAFIAPPAVADEDDDTASE